MRLILFIQLLNLECPEVLAHPQRHPPAGSLLSSICLSFTLSLDLPDDVPLYLVLVIPVEDGRCEETATGFTISLFPWERGLLVLIWFKGQLQDWLESAIVFLGDLLLSQLDMLVERILVLLSVNEHRLISSGRAPLKCQHLPLILLQQYVVVWIISDTLTLTLYQQQWILIGWRLHIVLYLSSSSYLRD